MSCRATTEVILWSGVNSGLTILIQLGQSRDEICFGTLNERVGTLRQFQSFRTLVRPCNAPEAIVHSIGTARCLALFGLIEPIPSAWPSSPTPFSFCRRPSPHCST